ncbi:type III pantothenate kinase [Owenweeksia hongkongensis]|uniref:type III pantothenate kinase n=1 Tax=Owenweeksia hongkongensis TaxID=253245 RepID=UPI003A90FB20
MNIIFDEGNTRTKVAWFDSGKLVESRVLNAEHNELEKLLSEFPVKRAIVSSVVGDDLYNVLKAVASFPVFQLSHNLRLPYKIAYTTPETLGLDRIALAAAAASLHSGKNCLVIDAGTCITYDLITENSVYLGGAISPGLQMRFKAVNHFTSKLPLVSEEDYEDLIGASTSSSIASGVVTGIKEEVRGTIQRYEERFPQLITIITGGDAGLFDALLKNSIFAAPEFLLRGLNNILDYHAEML